MTLASLVKATALLVIVLLAVRGARRARASVRHVMLATTFVALAALPVATAWLPAWDLPVLPATPALRGSDSVSHDARRKDRAGPVDSAAGSADGAESGATGDPARWLTTVSIQSVAVGFWLAGAVGVLLPLGIGLLRLQRLRRAALPCLTTRRHLPALAHDAGVAARVDVVVHQDITAPITCGILRPAILLPADAPDWPAAAMTRALVHELEHVKRRDWLVQIIARAVCALYWFHPLVWVAYRQLCLQAEHACDDAVVMREEETGYAEQLVALARRMTAGHSVVAIGMAQRSDLAARVSALLDASRPRGRAGLRPAGAIAAGALALLLALAPLQLTATDDERFRQGGDESVAARGAKAAAAAGAAAGSQSAARRREESPRRTRTARLDRLLVEAAAAGDLQEVRELLADGANINAAVLGDGSPLIVAARGGHQNLVQLLLDGGADVDRGVPGDGAPLIMAARQGHLRIVQLLLDRGANVEVTVDGDENALIGASAAGHSDVVQLLVARGANVNARVWADGGPRQPQGEWRTPLGMALTAGHQDLAALLRASGAVE